MNKKKEILKKHGSSIWYSENEQTWYCYIPDAQKGRVKRKRKNKEDIENVLYEAYLRQEQSSNNILNNSQRTFCDLFEEFIEYKKKQVGNGTIKRMMADWKKFYLPYPNFIEKPFLSITKIDIDCFLNQITIDYQIKDKAFRNLCGILKQTLQYAVDAEYMDRSPYRVKINKKSVMKNRKKPSEKEIFHPEEKQLLIDEMERRLKVNPSNTIPLAIMLDFEIGVRVGELMALKDTDIKQNKIEIQRQQIKKFYYDRGEIKQDGWEIVDYTKSECGNRSIPLTNKAMQYIARIKNINKQYGLSYNNFLFVTNNNSNITIDAVSAQLKRACQKINIPVRRMHKIRKTYASTLYQNGVPITIISKMLGHADETTTLKHYIFNVKNNQETDDIVLKALQDCSEINVTTSDQKIVRFPTGKKMGNPNKHKVSQA